MREIKLHWAFKINNFGDMFTLYLLTHYLGHKVRYASPKDAQMFGTGSILERMPPGFSGIVFGTGKKFEASTLPDLSRATVLGLRGKLTAGRMEVPLFDPGVLSFMFCKTTPKYDLGVVPYYHDHTLAAQYPNAKIINCYDFVPDVINSIGECRSIISSALHGMIVADSLGIPNKYVVVNTAHAFKARDYHTVPVSQSKESAVRALDKLRIILGERWA